ncbi:MAG TPA: alpha/beta hydrolase [Jiangellales bacterium]|nr:alpha/beta hydrolase [Jiangellales bacterium]
MAKRVRVQGAGDGQQTLLLLHGLGATGDVWNSWRPLLERHWPGRWLAPDLPGHGGSEPLDSYSFETLAAAIADVLDSRDRLVILGHSLGGVLGLVLAGDRFDLAVDRVVGVGIKVAWSEDELVKARQLSERRVAWFPTRGEAASRYLRISGLTGLLEPDSPEVDTGIRQEAEGWRLALDPAAFGVGAPDMPALLASSRAPVLLARGESDAMVTDEHLARLGTPTATLPGLGHNAHVEDPAAVFRLVDGTVLR